MSIPPNVQGNVLVVQALDEFRTHFKAVDYSSDPRAVVVDEYGNHCGVGGGQDKNGTGAAVLEGVTGYYQNLGIPISDVPPDLKFDPTQPVAIRTEAYQTAANGDVLTDADGHPRLTWPVEGERGSRDTVPVGGSSGQHSSADTSGDFQGALFDAFNNPPTVPKDSGIQLASVDTGEVSDAGPDIRTEPPVDDSTIHETASVRAAQEEAQTQAALSKTNAGLNLVQNLDSLQHWGQANDLSHFGTALGLVNNLNILSDGAVTQNLGSLDGLNTVSGYLNLAQSIESGNTLGTLSAINSVSGQAIDNAIGSAVGNTGVPYVGVVMALSNMDAHPGQAIGSLVGMCWGPMGSAVGGLVGGLLDSSGILGGGSPPPPSGVVHFEWNADGSIATQVEQSVSGGGQIAQQTAHSIQDLLGSIVQAVNAQNPSTADDVAINPYLLPKIGFSSNHAWIEITNPDGSTGQQSLDGIDVVQTLLKVLTDNGAIAPAWLVQTQLERMHTLQAQGASPTEIAAELGAGKGGGAQSDNAAYALQGNAAESADYKTQTFGALVVHINADPQVQAHADKLQTTLVNVLRDADSDGYMEATQSVAAHDAQGHAQGSLVLDFNGNGLIETRDILNLGGNTADSGNLSAAGQLANTYHDKYLPENDFYMRKYA